MNVLPRTIGVAILLSTLIAAARSVGAATPSGNNDSTTTDNASSIESVIVTGSLAPEVTDVPGGTAVVNGADLQTQSIANTADALKFVPGLFAQSVDGGEGTRLSIRGSGITKGGFTWGNGVQILFDGMPLSSPLGTPYESFEPNAYRTIVVYKGANAFRYGATQLGGAIDFVQHTGYDSDLLFVRTEGGTYGYQRDQISSGHVLGGFDYYVTVTHFSTDGYQYDSNASSNRVIGNVGYRYSDRLQTRFYYEYAQQYQLNINSVTLAQLEKNPRLNPGSPNGSRTNPGSSFAANKTSYEIDDNSNLEFGVEYKDPPLHNGNEPQRTYWHTSDWSAELQYTRHDEFWHTHESDTVFAFLPSAVIGGSGAIDTNDITKQVEGSIRYGGYNRTLLVSNDFALSEDLWLLTGVAGIWQERDNRILNSVASGVDPDLEKRYSNVTPRGGLRYDVSQHVQLYGNVSRLIEAPQIISYAASTNGVYTGYTTQSNGSVFNSRNLTVQSGTSYEVGTRGATDRFRWDVDFYRERLNNELLTIFSVLPSPTAPNGVSFTENAPPTLHQGIEASLYTVLWRGDGQTLSLRQSYAWNDFRFVHEAPEQMVLPGLPKQTYQAQAEYQHPSGFYANVDVDASLTAYPVDYANQAYAPAYALFGVAIGYARPSGQWRIFVEGQNLTDKKYASFTATTGVASATSAVYTPGEGRTVIAGAAYAFK